MSDDGGLSPLRSHLIAGRITGASGVVTFCTCGLAFFAAFEGPVKEYETDEQRRDATTRADVLWGEHRSTVSEAAPFAEPEYRSRRRGYR